MPMASFRHACSRCSCLAHFVEPALLNDVQVRKSPSRPCGRSMPLHQPAEFSSVSADSAYCASCVESQLSARRALHFVGVLVLAIGLVFRIKHIFFSPASTRCADAKLPTNDCAHKARLLTSASFFALVTCSGVWHARQRLKKEGILSASQRSNRLQHRNYSFLSFLRIASRFKSDVFGHQSESPTKSAMYCCDSSAALPF